MISAASSSDPTVSPLTPQPNPAEPMFLLGHQVGIAEPTSLSAEDVIARIVAMEWQVHGCTVHSSDTPTTASLQASLARGAVRPQRSMPPPVESLATQLQAARDAHLDGQLVLMVDGTHYASPGAMIPLTPDSKIALLRLALITRS